MHEVVAKPFDVNDLIARATLFDQTNGIVTFWTSNRAGGVEQIFAARVDMTSATPNFGAPLQLSAGLVSLG